MEQILSYKMFPDQPSGWCTPQLPALAKKISELKYQSAVVRR